MNKLRGAIQEFLDQKRIAVAGVSRNGDQPANIIFRKLRDAGYQVFAVNPRAKELEGAMCYPTLGAIPEPVDGVVLCTSPEVSEALVKECVEVGINRVWMHRSFGDGSVSEAAVRYCQEKDVTVIPGGCPMMFVEPVDIGHKCMRFLLKISGRLPTPELRAAA